VGNVDVLRAAAAFAVVVGHAYALGGRTLPVKASRWQDVPLITTVSGVWLFFAISGYVIARPFVDRLLDGRPLPELVPYALRRSFRIFPLYWIALTAVILITGSAGTRTWQFPVHYALLNNLVPGREGALFSVAWTLTLEVLFYMAVPLLAVAVHRGWRSMSAERLATLVVASWAASIAFTVFADLRGDGTTALWLRGSFPAMWQMFCPGILLAVAPHLRAPEWRRWLVDLPAQRGAGILVLATLAAGAVLSAAAPLRFGVVPYVLAVDASRPLFAVGYGMVLAAAIRARPWEERVGRWVLHLGLVSYGIYLLHAVLLDFLLSSHGRGLIPLPQRGLVSFAVHIAFLAGLTVPLAMASWRWLEQPMIGLAATLADRWRSRVAGARRT
jgi:peptidoglycan/LPS O-acetylase OafA/YrhL